MSATNRAAIINKLFKVAKKHYPPILPPSNRTVLEHMMFACCLENTQYEAADESFARLQEQFFDWNEVRVTTAVELAEVMKQQPDPSESAVLIKKALHGVFETYYNFDLESLKKENLRKTVQQMERFKGVSSFVVSYVAQVALGGHYIPLDRATLNMMVVLGAATEAEIAKGKIPGLERTIPKSKGVEFTSIVHQLAAAFHKSKFNKDIRNILPFLAGLAADAPNDSPSGVVATKKLWNQQPSCKKARNAKSKCQKSGSQLMDNRCKFDSLALGDSPFKSRNFSQFLLRSRLPARPSCSKWPCREGCNVHRERTYETTNELTPLNLSIC